MRKRLFAIARTPDGQTDPRYPDFSFTYESDAERRFKQKLVRLIVRARQPVYPTPTRLVGQKDLNGRQVRWRKEVLEAAGWRHDDTTVMRWCKASVPDVANATRSCPVHQRATGCRSAKRLRRWLPPAGLEVRA